MKKVLAIIGSQRKKGTYDSVKMFEEALMAHEEVDFEYIMVSDIDLELCTGCKFCFDKGEQFCPLKDERETLIDKIAKADGIVMASPNYAFHISGRMKNLIDRIAYTFHRPRYFEKTFTTIVVQGIYGGHKVRKYLESTGNHIGFQVTKGCVVNTLEPMTEKRYDKMRETTKACADRFYKGLIKAQLPKPSLIDLMMFRMTRTGIKNSPVKLYDYEHFREVGWFEMPYYYNVKLSIPKQVLGNFFDFMGKHIAKMM